LFDAVTAGRLLDTHDLSNHPRAYVDFRQWVTSVTPHDDSKDVFPLSFVYSNLLWTGSTVRQRWRFISGNFLWSANAPLRDLSSGPPIEVSGSLQSHRLPETVIKSVSQIEGSSMAASTTLVSSKQHQTPSKRTDPPKASDGSSTNTGSSQSKASIQLAAPEKAVSDWTAQDPKGVLSPHLAFARTIDWANTPLGPMEEWSPEFNQVTNLVMSNHYPAAIFWVRSRLLLRLGDTDHHR